MKTFEQIIPAGKLPSPDQLQDECQKMQQLKEERLLNRELMTYLWELMARLYGHKWTSSYGAQIDPGNVWAATLKGISQERIRVGFGELVRLGLEWPPSAPEFRELCCQSKKHKSHAYIHYKSPLHPMNDPDSVEFQGFAITDQTKLKRMRDAGKKTIDEIKQLMK